MRKMPVAAVLTIAITFLSSCGGGTLPPPSNPPISPKAQAAKNFGSYSFNPAPPLAARVLPAPDFVSLYLGEMDAINDYANYSPSEAERAQIAKSLDALPPDYKKTLTESLLGIYFIQNYLGSSYTEYVLDTNNKIYTFIAINPAVLKNTASEWLTQKELSCFAPVENTHVEIRVTCGYNIPALDWVLMQAASLAVDYAKGVTPYPEKAVADTPGRGVRESWWTKGIWKEENRFDPSIDFPFQADVTFYGIGGGPKIGLDQAPEVYKKLSKTPVATLHGATGWAMDFAEFMAFYHVTQKLRQPYRIDVFKNGFPSVLYAPATSPAVRARFQLADRFYTRN
jgi:hypothetical protein